MKGFKALRALPFEKTVPFTATKTNTNSWYYCRVDNFAYTADVAETKNGMVLVVCLYGAKTSKSKYTQKLPIIERHFISEMGEVSSERFDEKYLSKAGSFTVTLSVVESWEAWSMRQSLTHGYNSSFFAPLRDADKVILGFARKHRLYEPVKKEFLPGKNYTSGLCWLAAQQTLIKQEKAEKAKERRERRIEDRMDQVPDVSSEFEQWVLGERFSPAAWFYKFKKREAHGVCGGCNERSIIPDVKNRKRGYCPNCGRPIQYLSIKNNDRFASYSFNVNYIERIAENEFVNRFFGVTKSYGNKGDGAYSNFGIREYGREFFGVKDGALKMTDQYKAVYGYYKDELIRWERIAPRFSVSDPGTAYTGNILEITQAIAENGIERLRNMDLRKLFQCCPDRDPIRLFKKVVEVPSLESMAKMGLERLAHDIVDLRYIHSCFDRLESGSPAKLLGVDRPVLRKFASIDISLSQYCFWKDQRLTLNDFPEFERFIGDYSGQLYTLRNLCREWDLIQFGTMSRYLKKQQELFLLDPDKVVMCWSDYLGMITRGDVEQNRSLLYPRNVKKEHDRLMVMKETLKDRKLSEKLSQRVKVLEELRFFDDNFVIFPLSSSAEFISESNMLNHCVKTYTERCADGKTNIFGLRRIECPDTPYFTVNIDNNGELIQNRGKNNCDPPKKVKSFVNKWLKFVEKKLKTFSLDPKAVLNKIQVRIGA